MVKKRKCGRQGTSPQYQWCYLYLVTLFVSSVNYFQIVKRQYGLLGGFRLKTAKWKLQHNQPMYNLFSVMQITDLTPSNTTDTTSSVTSPLKAIAQEVPSLLRTYQRNDVVWNNGMCLEKMLTDQMSCVAWQPPTVPRVAGHVHLCGHQKFVYSFLFPIDWAQNVAR